MCKLAQFRDAGVLNIWGIKPWSPEVNTIPEKLFFLIWDQTSHWFGIVNPTRDEWPLVGLLLSQLPYTPSNGNNMNNEGRAEVADHLNWLCLITLTCPKRKKKNKKPESTNHNSKVIKNHSKSKTITNSMLNKIYFVYFKNQKSKHLYNVN